MQKQQKNLIGILATGVCISLVTGCGQGSYGAAGGWEWTPSASLSMNDAPAGSKQGYNQTQSRPIGNAGSSNSVMMSPGAANSQAYAYAEGIEPEFDRRDDAMNIRSTKAPLSMGWAENPRPSLDNMRVFYTSSNPNRYVYPSTTPGQWNGHSTGSSGSHRGGHHSQTQSYGYVYEYGFGYKQNSSRGHGQRTNPRPSNRPAGRPAQR